MLRKKKPTGLLTVQDVPAGEPRGQGLPAEVDSYLSHIRALIVAGNIERACKSFAAFQSRYACTWDEVEEIRELEMQLNRLKPATG